MSTRKLAPGGAPSEIDAFYAGCFVRRNGNAAPMSSSRSQARAAAVQSPFRLPIRIQPTVERDIRMDERRRERARMVQELHDTLLQGFVGASLLLHQAVEQTPADSHSKPALSRALDLVYRAIDQGRAAMRGMRTTSPASPNLEQAFSNLIDEVTTGQTPRLLISTHGEPRTLSPAVQQEVFLIGREAVMNALRHSKATEIEIDVRYLDGHLSVFVRDNGCGINPETVQKKSGSHWGLSGMRERAENLGAQFEIRRRPGRGTEVRVSVPADLARDNQLIAVCGQMRAKI